MLVNRKTYFYFLSFLFIVVIPKQLLANSDLGYFLSDNIGRSYSSNTFEHTLFPDPCKETHSVIDIPTKGLEEKGIPHLSYKKHQEMLTPSSFFIMPLENILSFKMSFDTLKGRIRIPINKKIPSYTKSIGLYIRGNKVEGSVRIFVKENSRTKIYHIQGYPNPRYEFYVVPIDNSPKMKLTLTKIEIIYHNHVVDIHKDLYFHISALHMLNFSILKNKVRSIALNRITPFLIPINLNNLHPTILKGNEPIHRAYPLIPSMMWNASQTLVINYNNPQAATLEIYGALAARNQKSFVLRTFLPATNKIQCLKIKLPPHLIAYSESKYQNSSILLHGFKYIPSFPDKQWNNQMPFTKIFLEKSLQE